MDDVDYVGERGLGAWLRQERERRGFSRNALAQAASVSDATILRYEKDSGVGYETLRILDALGVKWSKGPMRGRPASVNRELHLLRRALEERGAVEPAGWPADLIRRLERVEEKVDGGAEATEEALARLSGAIARIEQRLDDEDDQRQRGVQ